MALASILYLTMVVCGFAAFIVVVFYGWLATNPPWRRAEAAPKPAVVEARRPDAKAAKHAA